MGKGRTSRTRGQGLTEYVVLVGLVGLLLVGAVQALRASMGGAFEKATSRLEDVSHQIEGSVDGPATRSAARPTGSADLASVRALHVGSLDPSHRHTYGRKLLQDASGKAISVDVCSTCDGVR